MTRYLLDTNIVSMAVRNHAQVIERLQQVPMSSLAISAITEGELLFGLALRPVAKKLRTNIYQLLLRVEVLPWDSAAASAYGNLRASLQMVGRSLGHLDGLIAAHAVALGAIMVSNDQAFSQVPQLQLEDWSR